MAKTKVVSAEAQVNELLREYKRLKEEKKAVEADMKEVESELKGLAEVHEDWFADANTKSFDNGKLVWKKSSEIKIEDWFSWDEFARAYPFAVKKDLSLSGVKKVLEVNKDAQKVYGISVEEGERKFSVEV